MEFEKVFQEKNIPKKTIDKIKFQISTYKDEIEQLKDELRKERLIKTDYKAKYEEIASY